MAKFHITVADTFGDNFEKLSTEEQALVEKKLERLAENPHHPSLRSKKIRGSDDCFESSINMDIRIVWRYENGRLIVVLDVGHHDILRRY
jgi:mRNA-degrading endonuclease RelE of RelBE toxin-antitoxin system